MKRAAKARHTTTEITNKYHFFIYWRTNAPKSMKSELFVFAILICLLDCKGDNQRCYH